MKTDLAEGDLVRLRSGGPAMSLQEITADGRAVCMWFDAQGHLQEQAFLLSTLQKQDEEGVSGS